MQLEETVSQLVGRELGRAKMIVYGPNNADDETREGDFGTWGDWRAMVLRVAEAAASAERERCARLCEAELPADPYAPVTQHVAGQYQMAEYLAGRIRGA